MSGEIKKERLELLLPSEIKCKTENAAKLQGCSLYDFVVAAALAKAAQVLEQQMILKLCSEDSQALAEALTNEPKPNKKAIEAAARYKERMVQT